MSEDRGFAILFPYKACIKSIFVRRLSKFFHGFLFQVTSPWYQTQLSYLLSAVVCSVDKNVSTGTLMSALNNDYPLYTNKTKR